MMTHQRAIREAKANASHSAGCRCTRVPSEAARNQAKGMAELDALARELSQGQLKSYELDLDTELDGTPDNSQSPSSSSNTPVRSCENPIALDRAAVREELGWWTSTGIMTDYTEIEDFDLVLYWQVCSIAVYC